MTEELKLYFCPRCRSHDVRTMFTWKNAFGILPRWLCKKCGYQNMMFPLAVYPKKSQNFRNKKKLNRLNKLNKKKNGNSKN